jgi:predicted secreted Zn-dependent protease
MWGLVCCLLCCLLAATACAREAGIVVPGERGDTGAATVLFDDVLVVQGAAEVRLHRRVWRHDYAVSGTGAWQVRESLDRLGPRSASDVRRYDGQTRWTLEWSLRYARAPGGACRLRSADVSLQQVILLPDLDKSSLLDLDETQRWRAFLQALERHELGHVERHKPIAVELAAAIAGLAPAPTCEAVRAGVNALGQAAIQSLSQADAEYDRATRHGATQGAVFP